MLVSTDIIKNKVIWLQAFTMILRLSEYFCQDNHASFYFQDIQEGLSRKLHVMTNQQKYRYMEAFVGVFQEI